MQQEQSEFDLLTNLDEHGFLKINPNMFIWEWTGSDEELKLTEEDQKQLAENITRVKETPGAVFEECKDLISHLETAKFKKEKSVQTCLAEFLSSKHGSNWIYNTAESKVFCFGQKLGTSNYPTYPGLFIRVKSILLNIEASQHMGILRCYWYRIYPMSRKCVLFAQQQSLLGGPAIVSLPISPYSYFKAGSTSIPFQVLTNQIPARLVDDSLPNYYEDSEKLRNRFMDYLKGAEISVDDLMEDFIKHTSEMHSINMYKNGSTESMIDYIKNTSGKKLELNSSPSSSSGSSSSSSDSTSSSAMLSINIYTSGNKPSVPSSSEKDQREYTQTHKF